MSAIREHYRKHAKSVDFKKGYHVVPEVVCKDGYRMSVQASKGHYCSPRENDPDGNYRAWEIAADEGSERALDGYHSENGIYTNVPTVIVNAVIELHGGLKEKTS